MKFKKVVSIGLLLFGAFSCHPREEEVAVYSIEQPPHFPKPIIPEANPMRAEVVDLGKKLFFDTQLSSDNSISCASCHMPENAFSDKGKAFSLGVTGQNGHRNSSALFNKAWEKALFWDGGANSLENQALAPITDHLEMNMDLALLEKQLTADAAYQKLFKSVFGKNEVKEREITMALAQYQRTLVSAGSRYDKYLLGKTALTAEELAGEKLVELKCASCHSGVLFTDQQYYNIGLDAELPDYPELDDPNWGRARITLDYVNDKAKYRTPTLRNLAFTAPYMHDGRFATLNEVLDFFVSGVKKSPTLTPVLGNGIVLSQIEKDQIILFLNTLNDYDFVSKK